MSVRLLIPPAVLAVSLQDARDHARVNGTDMDSEIAIRVEALTADAEHLTGRVIINRTYQVTLPAFEARIALPAWPLFELRSIEYFDMDGVERTLDPGIYAVNDDNEPGYVELMSGHSWPAAQTRRDAVRITVVCGYGADHTTTPPAFKGYILAKVKEYFAPAGTPESPHLVRALDSLKVY